MSRPPLTFALLSALAGLPLLAQENPAKSPREALGKSELRNYDIRDVEALKQTAGAPRDALLAQRQGTVAAYSAAPGVRINAGPNGLPRMYFSEFAPLTAASAADPVDIAKSFLRAHRDLFPFSDQEIDALRLTVRDVKDDATHLGFNQTVNGVEVFQGHVKFTLNHRGQVVQAGVGDVIPGLTLTTTPALTAEDAVRAAYRSLALEPPAELTTVPSAVEGRTAFRNPGGERLNDILADLAIFPMTPASGRLAWRLYLDLGRDGSYETLVDAADGRPLFRHDLRRFAGTGFVWRQSPIVGTRQMVPFPDSWLAPGALVTSGNNVDAYLDTDGNDAPDTAPAPGIQGGRAFSASQNFNFPFGDGTTLQDPRDFQAAAVTNAFYFINVAHDFFYLLGFDEAAGNMQLDNFGRGGLGSDQVLAEVQDRFATDNAVTNLSPDGTPLRIELGIWTQTRRGRNLNLLDDRDSAYEGVVIVHEYGHGVSTRIVGQRTNISCLFGTQSGAMGEGWSDYFASSFFNDPIQGAYLGNNPRGIRRQNYDTYTFTFADLGNLFFEVHLDGEIWAATLWDLRRTVGQALADRLVINGLKTTPCRPNMIQARDAILAADVAINAGAARSRIWEVFARHGMGFSAAGLDGTALRGTVFTAALDLPPDLQPGNRPPLITSQPPAAPGVGQQFVYRILATDPDGGTVQFQLLPGSPAGAALDPSTGILTWTATFVGGRAAVAVTDGQGGRVVHGFALPSITTLTPGQSISISAPVNTDGFAVIDVPAGSPVLQITLREGFGDPDIFLFDPNGQLFAIALRDSTTDGTVRSRFPCPSPVAG